VDCVYHAFTNHMEHLHEPQLCAVFDAYIYFKRMSHGNNPTFTFAGVVPYIYWQMLLNHNTRVLRPVEMSIERMYVDQKEYWDEANPSQRALMKSTDYWGNWVDEIALKPAIYCLLNEQHATFSHDIPDWPGARVLMAIQLVKQNEK